MNLVIGIFDLFAYSVPGSLYLALMAYLAIRLGVVDPAAVNSVNGVVLVGGLVLLSYLLGFLAYPLGAVVDKLLPASRRRDPRAEFLRRNPAARDRDYVRTDTFLLLCGLQMQSQEVAADPLRLRATGLMLRNSAPQLVLAAVVATIEAFGGPHPVFAAACAVVFVVVAVTLVVQSRKLVYWARLKTLELCFWLPDVDLKTAPKSQSAQP